MGVSRCADLLRVSERTIRNWESGTVRIPYAAYKLVRVLRGGRYLADPIWQDYRVYGQVLITPEGHRFHAGDLAWWSLLVRRARAFDDLCAAARTDERRLPASRARERTPARSRRSASTPPASSALPACPVDLAPTIGVGSGDRKCAGSKSCSEGDFSQATDLEGNLRRLPPTNRGVSETERDAGKASLRPLKVCAAPLPKAGGAAPRSRLGAALALAGGEA